MIKLKTRQELLNLADRYNIDRYEDGRIDHINAFKGNRLLDKTQVIYQTDKDGNPRIKDIYGLLFEDVWNNQSLTSISDSIPPQMFSAIFLEETGISGILETSFDITADTPLQYIPIYTPGDVNAIPGGGIIGQKFRITDFRYWVKPTNAVTYELWIFENAAGNEVFNRSYAIYNSGAGKIGNTMYYEGGNRTVFSNAYSGSGTNNKLFWAITWSGVPGLTKGFISIRGEMMR